jgi:hypothetical protein
MKRFYSLLGWFGLLLATVIDSSAAISQNYRLPGVNGWEWRIALDSDGSLQLVPEGTPVRTKERPSGRGSFADINPPAADVPVYGRLALSFGGVMVPLPDALPAFPAGYYVYQGGKSAVSINGNPREMEFPAALLGDIEVSRQVLITRDGGSCRWLNVLRNVSAERKTFFLILFHQSLPGRTGVRAIRKSPEIPAAEKGDTWFLGGPLTEGTSKLYMANILQGPKTKAPLAAADFEYRDFDGPELCEVERPYWTYAVTLEPGESGVVMTVLIVDTTVDALAAKMDQSAPLQTGWWEEMEEWPSVPFLNFVFDAPVVTMVQPENLGTYLNEIPIRINISGGPLKLLRVGASAYGLPYEEGKLDLSMYYYTIYYGPWNGTEFVSSMNVADLYQSFDGWMHIWVKGENENGEEGGDSHNVFDGRPNRNMARITSPSRGSYVRGETTISGEFFTHNLPGRGCLYLDQTLLKEKAVADSKTQYPGWRLSAGVDTGTLADGPHTAKIIIYDAGGQNVGSDSAQFTVDNSPPEVTISSPLEGALLGGTVPISFSAVSKFRILGLSLYIDGLKVQEKTGNTSVLESTFDWDTLSASNGTHEIRVVAVDDRSISAQKTILVQVRNTLIGLSASRRVEKAWLISRPYGVLTFSVVEEGKDTPAKFVILRKTGTGTFQKILEVEASAVPSGGYTYLDKFLEKNIIYTYRIEAVDGNGRAIGLSPECPI